jgi:NADPH2:quinone reductase
MQRRGDVPLPADGVPGVEGVGIVESVGDGVSTDLVGQRVVWSKVNSSYASHVQAAAEFFVPVPDSLSDFAAAGILMQGVTAQYLATSTTDLQPGDVALVTAAAGGVGLLLTQFLQSRGTEVIGVVGSSPKVDATRSNHTLIDSKNLLGEVRTLAPGGVAAVFDAAGGDASRYFAMLRPRGICVLYGAAGGPISPIAPSDLGAGSFYLTRTAGRDYASAPDEWLARAQDVMGRAAAGELVADVSEVLPLANAADAHRRLEARESTGKILLRISE